MSLRQQLENLVAEMLPPGAFWRGPAAERFIRAVAGAMMPAATLAEDIFARIQPETAARPVLEQWWEYLSGGLDCIAAPASDDELRAAVVRLWRSEFSGTAAGLTQMILGFLPLVDVRESLRTSALPCELPCPLEPSGRVLEIWYPLIQNTAEQVECVARRFMRDGDVLRLVTPSALLRSNSGVAGDSGLAYIYANGGRLQVERAPGASAPATETALYTPSDEQGFVTLATVFPSLTDQDSVLGQEIRWQWQHDFGAGFVATTTATSKTVA